MNITQEQREQMQQSPEAGDAAPKGDTQPCPPCLAIRARRGAKPPTYPDPITIKCAVFWDSEAVRHADDGCNSYAVTSTHEFAWNRQAEQIAEFPITEAEYASPHVTVFIWADPPATATFRYTARYAVGRLKLKTADIKNKGAPARSTTYGREILFEVDVLESPLFYLITLLHQNETHPAVLDMQAWPPAKSDEVMTTLGFPAERKNDWGGLWAAGTDGSYLENMSEFDLKPLFSPTWGERNRIENNERVYFYDVWSNIHYGYIGNTAGFTAERLNGLAGNDPRGDSAADQAATRLGWDIRASVSRQGSLDLDAKRRAIYPLILNGLRQNDLFLDKQFYIDCKKQ
ncbi:polymorphic toxin type 44 domain-containing protein [Chondromyces apiculatus]|uniref:Bacterial toxin 44 domain-containing protein n=1 Tax=Chondromyces apiculatus DSM 436 TaxID=1192034 RepID=A0A017SSL5_9BACT|nr:polymorphic toxin type 44 domain-containing protein [Chondromyces apiculatus]EYE99977.1 Hypothetical protein CAP_1870 [Chondromyces apiculatus DSM 436]